MDVISPPTKPLQKHGRRHKYSSLIARTREWPIVQLSRERRTFIRAVSEEVYEHFHAEWKDLKVLRRRLEETIYAEKLRVARYNWRIDRALRESTFWAECERQLFLPNDGSRADEKKQLESILSLIIKHYTQEMIGKFRHGHYRLVKRLVVSIFTRLLNTAQLPFWRLLTGKRLQLIDKMQIVGNVEQLRSLAQRGILIIAPTHFSHVDSVLLGWLMRHLGLPPLLYGAGINLFNMRFFAYFMHRSGAYKIDRRKKNPIYLETLKTFSKRIIKYGCHSLFFPGGTRSRSGSIEKNLKLGLLNTAISAQREFCKENELQDNPLNTLPKVFLVPIVINYHFVLEAPSLIKEYLRAKGKSRYYEEEDVYSTSYKILKFLITFLSKGSELSVSIGRGLDVLGNYVNDKGESIDAQGRTIDIQDYFLRHNHIEANKQREHEYSRRLSSRLIEEFYKNNQVLSSHVVAFVAWRLLFRENVRSDRYDLLRLPAKEIQIPVSTLEAGVGRIQEALRELEAEGEVRCAPTLRLAPEAIIKEGVAQCGVYHSKRPLFFKRDKESVGTQDLACLLYYHNRLTGYGLEELL